MTTTKKGGRKDRTGEVIEQTPAASDKDVATFFPGGKKPKKGKKERDQDRPIMDRAGDKDFLRKQADADRKDAKTRHLDKALKTAREAVSTMAKAAAHGLASDSWDAKEACLEELATLGNHVRDEAREGMRNAKGEKKNVQPSKVNVP